MKKPRQRRKPSNTKKKVIKVCCPFYSDFEALKFSMRKLFFCKEYEFVFGGFRQSGVPRWARNHGINDGKSQKKKQKLVNKPDYFLTNDTDIVYDLSTILRLLKHNKDVICAPYRMRNNPLAYDCGEFTDVPGEIKSRYKIFEHGVKKIGWAGAGLMLIKADVFEKLEYPWYRQIMIEKGDEKDECSEDVGFCVNLDKHGIDLWCDFDINVGHLPRPAINWDMWSNATQKELAQKAEFLKKRNEK